ncbi:MAG TPA: phenylalanine--tRNA ligase subunit beta, partial [Candidatus Aenigmarchaeota archaeon]|nr:phenylalanine--tRNA ligase subunit beta [Candidatus Aenigmarchaeota archaeon]
MPVISVSATDLKNLIGRKMTDEELKTILPLNKLEIDSWNGDEIKIEVTPDRPDLYSPEGIARQLRAWMCIKTGPPSHIVSRPVINIKAENVSLRPHIVAGVVRGLKMNDYLIKSLMQLQEMVDLTLGRDRKKVAIGVHDLRDVKPPLRYTEVRPVEISFVPLGSDREMNLSQILEKHPKGIQYRHLMKGNKYPVLLDSSGNVLSFPPIIN